MRVRLDFELPEEESEYRDAINGAKYIAVLQNLDNHLRSIYKYGKEGSKVSEEAAEEIRSSLYDLAHDMGVCIWE